MRKPKKSILKIYGALFCIIALGICIIFLAVKDKNPESAEVTVFDKPRLINPFQITTATSKFTEKDLIDHWTFLLFGYTHCSDVCPENLNLLKHVYQQLSGQYKNLQILFISLDESDSAEDVSHYASSFNNNFIGATGTQQEMQQLQQQFGIFAQADKSNNIQHSSSILLINPQAKWVALLPYGTPASQIITTFNKIAGA
ncbi:MAG TPA: SCO family protein [Gammaproteobacteria bacterium]|nr:SCO family protein [Gammaproteobacteria bacterium]